MSARKLVVIGSLALLGACAEYLVAGGGPGQSCGPGGECQTGLFCSPEGICLPGDVLYDREIFLDPVDVLVVVDNSGDMARKQLEWASYLARSVASGALGMVPRVGVVTTGIASPGCTACVIERKNSCINHGGESGRLEDRQGDYRGESWPYEYSTRDDPACPQVLDRDQVACLFDTDSGSGRLLTGNYGCGYERGLEAMRLALDQHGDWLRPEARLYVVVLSDEEDCGAVGEVEESGQEGGRVCYYAASGRDPEGNTSDRGGRPYALTPVSDYRDFLLSLKGGDTGKVDFVAIVGVADPAHPETTTIEYVRDQASGPWRVQPACEIPGCREGCPAGDTICQGSCQALPGTRYLELAGKFGLGEHGWVASVCEGPGVLSPPDFVGCPQVFRLAGQVTTPENLVVLVNGTPLPAEYCPDQSTDRLVACSGGTCPGAGQCRPTWTYQPPAGGDTLGLVKLDEDVDPCGLEGYGYRQHWQVVEIGGTTE